MGADSDPSDPGRDLDAGEAAGEGLLVHMRVEKNPPGEHRSVRPQHLPGVGVMVPARIGVAQSDVEAITAGAVACDRDPDHVGFAGGGGNAVQKRGRRRYCKADLAEG